MGFDSSHTLHARCTQCTYLEVVRSFGDFIHILNAPTMLTFAAALVGLWFFGLMAEFTMGGMIHLLLVAGLVLALTKIIQEATPIEQIEIEPETV